MKRAKALGLWTSLALVVGNMVGAGAYMVPASLGSFGSIGLVGWVVTAAGALCLAAVFARLGKSFELRPGYSVRVSGGLAGLTPDFARGYALAGLTLTFAEQLSPFASYDGLGTHLGLAWKPLEWLSLSGLWIEMEEIGPSISGGWNAAATAVDE